MNNSILLAIFLIVIPSMVFCQKETTVYYDSNQSPTTINKAVSYSKVVKINSEEYRIQNFKKKRKKWVNTKEEKVLRKLGDTVVIMYSLKGKKEVLERRYSKKENGYAFKEFYNSGIRKVEGFTKSIIPMCYEGYMYCFYESGMPHSIRLYENSKLINSKMWDRVGNRYLNYIYDKVDEHAYYPGGEVKLNEKINKIIKYPVIAQENGITGDVIIRFVIDEKGVIAGTRVIKGADISLERETLRVLKEVSKGWKPALYKGQKTKDAIEITMKFRLS